MNYTEVKASAQAYADRYDTEVTAEMDNMIEIVEGKLNRRLRVYQMEANDTQETVAGTSEYSFPTDFIAVRNIHLETADGELTLDLIPPALANNIDSDDYSNPVYYTIINNKFRITPTPTSATTLTVDYFKKIPNLKTNTTNWLADLYPDVYIAGICLEISVFVQNALAVQYWTAVFEKLIDEMNQANITDSWNAPTMSMKFNING